MAEKSGNADAAGPADVRAPASLPSTSAPALHPDRAQGAQYLKLVALGGLIGIPAAVVAWAFLGVVHWLENLLWTDLPDALGADAPPWYLVLGLPILGALVVALARHLLPGDGGHIPLAGIGHDPTPWRYAPGIALAAIGTLGFGAVLGPEAPLVALGSAVGMAAVGLAKVKGPAEQVIATAGSFSAISALFGGPLVAGIMLLEAGLAAGSALMPALIPGLAAAAIGYVVFVGLGDWGGLHTTKMAVPQIPDYLGTRIIDLVLAVAVGIIVALLMRQVHQLGGVLDRVAGSAGWARRYAVLLGGGALVGGIAVAITAMDIDVHEILFSGQNGLPGVLAETSVGVLLIIIVAKVIAYGICMGCGFRGGPVFPAIFIGVAVATIGCVLFGCSITWALAAGTAAGMTAGTGLVFTALLFAMLLTGTAGLEAMPAAVLATLAAWLTGAALKIRDDGPSPQTA